MFLAGLAPVVVAFLVRLCLRESERWQLPSAGAAPPTPRELFQPAMRRVTLSGFIPCVAALLAWWACNAFIPLLGGALASEQAAHTGLAPPAAGIFAVFSLYLPELFPARLRATGSGFCYNIGRVFAAAGPFVVGLVTVCRR